MATCTPSHDLPFAVIGVNESTNTAGPLNVGILAATGMACATQTTDGASHPTAGMPVNRGSATLLGRHNFLCGMIQQASQQLYVDQDDDSPQAMSSLFDASAQNRQEQLITNGPIIAGASLGGSAPPGTPASCTSMLYSPVGNSWECTAPVYGSTIGGLTHGAQTAAQNNSFCQGNSLFGEPTSFGGSVGLPFSGGIPLGFPHLHSMQQSQIPAMQMTKHTHLAQVPHVAMQTLPGVQAPMWAQGTQQDASTFFWNTLGDSYTSTTPAWASNQTLPSSTNAADQSTSAGIFNSTEGAANVASDGTACHVSGVNSINALAAATAGGSLAPQDVQTPSLTLGQTDTKGKPLRRKRKEQSAHILQSAQGVQNLDPLANSSREDAEVKIQNGERTKQTAQIFSRPSKYFRQRASMAAAGGCSFPVDASWDPQVLWLAPTRDDANTKDVPPLTHGARDTNGKTKATRGQRTGQVMAKMYFHRKKEAWRAEILIAGIKKQKSFSCRLYGHDRARLMCEWARRFVLHTSRLPTDEETCASLAVLMDCPSIKGPTQESPSQFSACQNVRSPTDASNCGGLSAVDGAAADAAYPASLVPPQFGDATLPDNVVHLGNATIMPRFYLAPDTARTEADGQLKSSSPCIHSRQLGQGTPSNQSGTCLLSSSASVHVSATSCKNPSESAQQQKMQFHALQSGSSSTTGTHSPEATSLSGAAEKQSENLVQQLASSPLSQILSTESSVSAPESPRASENLTPLSPATDNQEQPSSNTAQWAGEKRAPCGGSKSAANFPCGENAKETIWGNEFEELVALKKLSRPKGSRAKRFNVGKKPFSGVRGIYFQQGLWKVKYRGDHEEAVKLFPYQPGDVCEMQRQFSLARTFLRQVIDKGRHLHDSDGDGLSEVEPAWLNKSSIPTYKNPSRKELLLSPVNEGMRNKTIAPIGRRRPLTTNKLSEAESSKESNEMRQSSVSIGSDTDEPSEYRRLLTLLPRHVEEAALTFEPNSKSTFFGPVYLSGGPIADWGPRYEGIKVQIQSCKKNKQVPNMDSTEGSLSKTSFEHAKLANSKTSLQVPHNIFLSQKGGYSNGWANLHNESFSTESTQAASTGTEHLDCSSSSTLPAGTELLDACFEIRPSVCDGSQIAPVLGILHQDTPSLDSQALTQTEYPCDSVAPLMVESVDIGTEQSLPVAPRRPRKSRPASATATPAESAWSSDLPLTREQEMVVAYPWDCVEDFLGAADDSRRCKVLEKSLAAAGRLDAARGALKSLNGESGPNGRAIMTLACTNRSAEHFGARYTVENAGVPVDLIQEWPLPKVPKQQSFDHDNPNENTANHSSAEYRSSADA